MAGRTTLRLADAEVLPFEFQHFTETLAGYADEVVKLADDLREKTETENALIREGVYKLAVDPRETFIVPEVKPEVPYLNFAPLQNELHRLTGLAKAFDTGKALSLSKGKREELNRLLKDVERALTREEGLPRRPWFTHHIYAPGFYTGYGVKTLPGVREAIEQRDFVEAQEHIGILAGVLDGFAEKIEQATGIIGK